MDRLHELIETLRTAKLRTAVTALSVAWGIFMLVVLLAAGAGIKNGAEHEFRDDATNSLWIYRGATSIPFEGHKIGRAVKLTDEDFEAIKNEIEGVEHITGRFYIQAEFTVSYGGTVSSFDVRACHPDHRFLENTIVTSGRFIDELDVRERRKVAIVGPVAVKRLFHGKDPIGEWIDVHGTMYRVVGVFDDEGGEDEQSKIYIPISTAQAAYGGASQIHQIMFTIADATDVEHSFAVVEQTRKLLARRHHFAPNDKRAIRVRNTIEDFQRIEGLLDRIRIFIWIVGFGTIVAGIVGVSNIMLISVRERTREIGIRKALGATPFRIVSQILLEALIVTGAAGYAGLVAGLALVEVVHANVPPSAFFRDPEVDFSTVVGATVILVLSGLVAGYFPARLASRVSPVVALRAA